MLAHKGMAVALEGVWETLSRALLELKNCTVVLTGHSLGGALAQVCVWRWRHRNHKRGAVI